MKQIYGYEPWFFVKYAGDNDENAEKGNAETLY